tara:strand:+ start:499 stop:963 length:465 start_codon:yes stop_codon:yes gene_type:complete
MDPNIWGPKLWFVIHTLALNYPDNPTYEDKRVMEEFFNNLKYTIPCEKCRIHYRQRLERDPIINYLDNKESIFRYTINLHNQVNKSLGKKIYTYEEVVQFYKEQYNKDSVKPENKSFLKKWINIKYVIAAIVALVILIPICVYLKKKYPKRLLR